MAKKASAKKQVLPRKMSALIEIALRDLRKAEAEPKKFVIDMTEWFTKETVLCETSNGQVVDKHDVCIICLAGSVMAFSLGAAEEKAKATVLYPDSYSRNDYQLEAINYLRTGLVSQAADKLELPDKQITEACKFDCTIPDYDAKKPEPFHKAMTKLQQKLAKAGL